MNFFVSIEAERELRGSDEKRIEGIELFFFDDVVRIDDDQHHVNEVDQFLIDARNVGKDGFILKRPSCGVPGTPET